MKSTWQADGLVRVESDNVDRYKRNFLQQVVCEFRFPILMELGDPKPPVQFVNALRKDYPILEMGNEVTLGIGGGATGSNHVHTMRSAKKTSSVSIKQSSLSIETSSYKEFADMKKQIMRVAKAAIPVIDSNFFTRIGLRYINVIDCEDDPVRGWINPALVAPLQASAFFGINEYAGKVSLLTEDGGCLLQHGLKFKPNDGEGDIIPQYFIDIDTFRNEVELDDVEHALAAMHQQAFNIFDWSIGDLARDHLVAENLTKKQRR